MSYRGLAEMKKSTGLFERIVACAAQEGFASPEIWVSENYWRIIANDEWVTAWQYAEDTKTENVNQDTGARSDVVNDGMILSAVQARKAETEVP
jgi:hypothetical protein